MSFKEFIKGFYNKFMVFAITLYVGGKVINEIKSQYPELQEEVNKQQMFIWLWSIVIGLSIGLILYIYGVGW